MSTILALYRAVELDLPSLVEAAQQILAQIAPAASDARIAAFPDARTVRYYQTAGLVGKPMRYDGRQAVYGYRHLLEIVAIKLLQARGLTLAQVQQALAAATMAQVEAAVRDAIDAAPPSLEPSAAASWTAPSTIAAEAPAPTLPQTREMIAAEVAPGVFVTVDPHRVGDPRAVIDRIAATLRA